MEIIETSLMKQVLGILFAYTIFEIQIGTLQREVYLPDPTFATFAQ